MKFLDNSNFPLAQGSLAEGAVETDFGKAKSGETEGVTYTVAAKKLLPTKSSCNYSKTPSVTASPKPKNGKT